MSLSPTNQAAHGEAPRRALAGSVRRGGERAARRPRTLWGDVWRQFRRRRLALLGVVVFGLIVLGVALGPLVYATPYGAVDFAAALQGPSAAHPFGTNDLGQDVLARILWGGRISIAVGLVAMLVNIGLGTLVGALAGYFGGWVDSALMRLTDVFLSLPQLPLLLLIIYLFREPVTAALGPVGGIFALIVLVIGGLNWMPVARLVRVSFLTLREAEFVTAAHALGIPPGRIIVRHLLPNTLGPVIVAATLAVGSAILSESTLSFLGLGFPPDTPTWGRMLYESQNFIEFAPFMVLFPGLCIFLSVLSINYIGDGLRDALDPQQRRS
ncbi:ABC transporter permease [Chloroflexia bacterium SDU3-3]|nr:ABC transporter permease [Chloroflexia bacterium SDU3-3]